MSESFSYQSQCSEMIEWADAFSIIEDLKRIFSFKIVKDSVWKNDVLIAEKKVSFFFRKNYEESFTRETKVFIVESCTVDTSIMSQKWLNQQSIRNTVRKRIVVQNTAFTLWNVFKFVKLYKNKIIKLSAWIECFYFRDVVSSMTSEHQTSEC